MNYSTHTLLVGDGDYIFYLLTINIYYHYVKMCYILFKGASTFFLQIKSNCLIERG